MKKHIRVLVLAGLVVGSLAVYTFAYQVDQQQDIVLIETFGKVTREIIGSKNPGLKFKWPYPFQKVIRYDSRVSVFEDTGDEATTKDKQNVLVTVYCAWRIAKPAAFHQVVKISDPEEKMAKVEELLRNLVRSAKKDVVGEHEMVDFINTSPDLMKLDEIEDEILNGLAARPGAPARPGVGEQALKDYSVEIVRVGIKSLSLPEAVTQKVIDAMKTERQKDIQQYETTGRTDADNITQLAESDRDLILAFAKRAAVRIRSGGDEAVKDLYREFKDVDFATFLRICESVEKELAEKTVFVLDGSQLPHIRWLWQGPPTGGMTGKGPGEAETAGGDDK